MSENMLYEEIELRVKKISELRNGMSTDISVSSIIRRLDEINKLTDEINRLYSMTN